MSINGFIVDIFVFKIVFIFTDEAKKTNFKKFQEKWKVKFVKFGHTPPKNCIAMSAVGQKKSENKLTRGRKKKTTKVNESLEDFEDKKDTFAKKTDASSKLSLIFDNELQIGFSSTRIDDVSGSGCGSASFLPGRKDQLPPCPLCGKVFQEGQELQR